MTEKAFQIGLDLSWTGMSMNCDPIEGCPSGWTRVLPPSLRPSERAQWTGTSWRVGPAPSDADVLAAAKVSRLSELAAIRFERETRGIVVGEASVATDRETASILTAAYVSAKEDPNYAIRWKVSPGVFVTLDATAIIAISSAVRGHVQACFDREASLTEEILTAPDLSAFEAIDIAEGWP